MGDSLLRSMLDDSTAGALDPGEGGHWAYLDPSLDEEGAREATDSDLVALFRADGKSWTICMPRGLWREWRAMEASLPKTVT